MSKNHFCACGCGKQVTKQKNKYLLGHNPTKISKQGIQKIREKFLGKTYEELYGKEKANDIKKKLWKNRDYSEPSIKGKTWVEYYGEEKANEMKKNLAEKNSNNLQLKDRKGSKNPAYKGAKDSLYAHWSPKLVIDINRKTDEEKIEVRCKYCHRWFTPTQIELNNRINALKRTGFGNDFYCSKKCKKLCSDHYQVLWPKYYKPYDNKIIHVEVSSELRKVVFERDEWACQKCGNENDLQCHHIDPVSKEPFFSGDPDSCTTLCKECHKEIHTRNDDCSYNRLRRCV